jgi:hypothetical protein
MDRETGLIRTDQIGRLRFTADQRRVLLDAFEQGLALLPGKAESAHAILPDQTLIRRCHRQPCYDRYESDAATTS